MRAQREQPEHNRLLRRSWPRLGRRHAKLLAIKTFTSLNASQKLLGNTEVSLLGVRDDLSTFFYILYKVGRRGVGCEEEMGSRKGACVHACMEAYARYKLTSLTFRTQNNDKLCFCFYVYPLNYLWK